jgi:hypothetical protein
MGSMKTLETTFSPRERFAIWLHLSKNVTAANGREQEQVDDLWEDLELNSIQEIVDASSSSLEPRDFSAEERTPAELTKEELAFLLGLLVRPIPVALSRHTLPIKRRLETERDKKGLKAVPAEAE